MGNCSENANCINTDGNYNCEYKEGYSGNGFECTDINECELGIDNCETGFECENIIGSFNCSCPNGSAVDDLGINCIPVAFITTWSTNNEGISLSNQITIPTTGTGYNYNIDCNNDGIYEAVNVTESYTCNYETAGIYQVAITGDFPRIYFNYQGDSLKILSIDQWGAIQWKSMEKAFYGCENLLGYAIDTPDLSNVTNISYMFANAILFNQDINNWNVSNVVNMSNMFNNATDFNQPLNSWNVSNVTNMTYMFYNATSFNQDIFNWNVSNVTDMNFMFYYARSFNKPLNNWDVGNVTKMSYMFRGTSLFNQDLSSWDVDQVRYCWDFYYSTLAWRLPKPNFTSCTP